MTQEQLARRSGVARWRIVKLEAGAISDLRVRDVDRCLSALDARLDLRAWYHGAAGDRLLDERHAALVGRAVREMQRNGWEIRVEVSFSDYGDRGSIDILGWHAVERSLAVEEIKSELGSIEGTLRPFDIKCRLAGKIARERFGWDAATIGRILILPNETAARRAVERHSSALNASLPARSRAIRSWLREPAEPIGGIWFVSDVQLANGKRNPSGIQRIRPTQPRSRTRDLTDLGVKSAPSVEMRSKW
jgi:hypothetical protein